MYLTVVSSRRPIGPRACSFWVLMPISAPKPNSSPSVNRVDALTTTAAASTSRGEAAWRPPGRGSRSPRCGRCRSGRCGRWRRRASSTTATLILRSRNSRPKSSSVAAPIVGHDDRGPRSSPTSSTPVERPRPPRAGTRRRPPAWTSRRLGRVAHARPLGLGVDDDGERHVEVGGGVDVDVAVAVAVDDVGHGGVARGWPGSATARPGGSGSR